MDKIIIFTNAEGGLSCSAPREEARLEVLVDEAVYADVLVPAVLDAQGETVTPEHTVQELVTPAVYRAETDDELLARVMAAAVPVDAINPQVVLASTLPTSRAFRSAWAQDAQGMPTVDMPKARAIKAEHIRAERNTRFPPFDDDYRLADEAGDAVAKAAVGVKRQTLRDIPTVIQPDLDAITTPDALEQYQPTWPV